MTRRWVTLFAVVALIVGTACTPSPEESTEGLQTRADQGEAEAQFNLGVRYDEGEGVPQDYVTRSANVVKDLAPWLSGLGHRLHGGTM